MPISDAYVVQYLLQTSLSSGGDLQWYEKESDGFGATWQGLLLELESIPGRLGARLELAFILERERVSIYEPARVGFLTQHYANPEDQRLAGLLRQLWRACTKQCDVRRNRSPAEEQRVRQTVFKRVIESHGVDSVPEDLIGIGEKH